jgi:hypothetical protein
MNCEIMAAALVALTNANVPPDVQELLMTGNPSLGVPTGALAAAIEAAVDAIEEADRIANTCDVPGCGKPVSCGWPSVNGYRRTCHAHSDHAV